MSKIVGRSFAVIVLLTVFLAQVGPTPAAAAFPGVNGSIVYVDGGDLWLMDADGNNQTQLTNTPTSESSPSWSSDGSTIAYVCLNQTAICLINPDGSDYQTVITSTTVDSVSWQPYSSQLLYQKINNLWTTDAYSPSPTQLTFSGYISDGHYSPNGNKIVYGLSTGVIKVMDSDGNNSITLSADSAGDYSPDWSPDGTQIVFARGTLGNNDRDIWVMDSADGANQDKITFDGADDDINAKWSPDGSRVLVIRNDGTWLVDPGHDLPEVKITSQVALNPDWQPLNSFVVDSPADLPDINPGDGICETSAANQCTLRAAIEEANAIPTSGELSIDLQVDVTLTTDLPVFTNTTAMKYYVSGNGHSVDGANAHQLINIDNNVTVCLSDITLKNGLKTTGNGGGIYNAGALYATNVSLFGNSANAGGGIYNDGVLTMIGSAIVNNTSSTLGGGIVNTNSSNTTIANSTLSGNSASYEGGGVINKSSGVMSLYNVTITKNVAGYYAGGLKGIDTSSTTLSNTLIAGNTVTNAGVGQEIYIDGSASITSEDHNLLGSSSLSTTAAIYGFTPNGTDVIATSDGSTPTFLTDILAVNLSFTPGHTTYHILVGGSPAIDAGGSATCSGSDVSNVDQRGVTRPQGAACDIGAYEADVQVFMVTNTNDSGPGSLRQAITSANASLNSPSGPDQIRFGIPGNGSHTISPASSLPAITESMIMDGQARLILDGTSAGLTTNGLTLASSDNAIRNMEITNFDGAGIAVTSGIRNVIRQNALHGNHRLDLDLGDDGVSFNHANLIAGPNNYQNYPVLDLATSDGTNMRLVGTLKSVAYQQVTVDVYANIDGCHATFFGGGQAYLGSFTVTPDIDGFAEFDQTLPVTVGLGASEPHGVAITATTGLNGTSEFSYCRAIATPNLNWAQADEIDSGTPVQQYVTDNFQEKWFKISVQPGARVHVKLISEPGSAVSLHSDPYLIYNELIQNDTDETSLSADTADTAFTSTGASASGSSSSAGYLPSRSLPSRSLPSRSLPFGSLPSRSLPSGALPSGALPSGSLPSGSLPSRSLPSRSLPSRSLPSGLLPSDSMEAYGTAARYSLLDISMNQYATEQTIDRDTYDYLGDMYVRVVTPYNLDTSFTLEVTVDAGVCESIQPVPNTLLVINGAAPSVGTHKSLILTDSARLEGTPSEITQALSKLQTLALRPDVDGIVIDLSDVQYERVVWANTQADANLTCPAAKNLVADEIKSVIDLYRTANDPSLQYIVLAGGARVIPFFQVADVAELAAEKDYVVPVAPSTASEAGLLSNLVAGQDAYGSQSDITQSGYNLPYPDLAVGRLVDTASDISAAIDAYIATDGVITPQSALVTGYDFVGDAAEEIKTQLELGTAATADSLIEAPGLPPTDPTAWTATQLKNKLLTGNYDLIALTGHFSAGDLLAADYTTQLSAQELELSSADLTNALVLTLGCHGGYSVPGADLIPAVSPNPDWAKAILRKGAAGYIAATGYAYGDTDLTEYGERLFVLISKKLRTGAGPVAVGDAMMEAKRQYLADTAQLTGIDHKTITEMTLYGLPMMKVVMSGAHLKMTIKNSTLVNTSNPVAAEPGASLGLTSSDVMDLSPVLTTHTLDLKNLSDNSTTTTTYMSGVDGVIANPFEPIYPKELYNVQVPSTVLRGVAFRGGTYIDQTGIIPLTTSPATETASAHQSFNATNFYPSQMWMSNYVDRMAGGDTRLVVFPVQFRSSSPTAIDGTLRTFGQLSLQFYYMPDDWSDPDVYDAAISAAPSIAGASAAVDNGDVTFNVNVTAEGTAGVQAVWVLYTGKPGSPYYGTWTALDLTQNVDDSSIWNATFTPAGNATDLLFMVQAVGGAGLTSLSTNNGEYYSVTDVNALPPNPPAATQIDLISPPSSGVYAETSEFTLELTSAGQPVAGKTVTLYIAGQQTQATTDASGDATIEVNLSMKPDNYTIQAGFSGDDEYLSSTASSAFTVTKQSTTLSMTPASASVPEKTATSFVATIKDASGNPLPGKSVVFVVHNASVTFVRSATANYLGKARLGTLPISAGVYTVDVYFSGTIPVSASSSMTVSDAYYQSSSLLNSGTLTLTETTKPTITASAKKADLTTYTAGTWTNQSVTVHFTCSDAGSGIATCPADQTYSTDGSYTANGTAIDNASNSANTSFGLIKIDKTAPTLAPAVSPNPVYLKALATATAGATDSGSGVASQSCAAVSTATIGIKTVACTATDSAGNISNANAVYQVQYNFTGFRLPVHNMPFINKMQAGRSVDIIFSLAGNQGLKIFAKGYPKSVPIACGSSTVFTIKTGNALTSGLKYIASKNAYTYTWKTLPTWAGTCRQFTVKFIDGRIFRLNFKFIK